MLTCKLCGHLGSQHVPFSGGCSVDGCDCDNVYIDRQELNIQQFAGMVKIIRDCQVDRTPIYLGVVRFTGSALWDGWSPVATFTVQNGTMMCMRGVETTHQRATEAILNVKKLIRDSGGTAEVVENPLLSMTFYDCRG